MNARRRYVLISPCRDEAAFMRRTLDSVAAQSVPPALWVVVDDGSKDETPEILAEYAARLPYLRVVRMLGWIAESVDDPELRFLHLRPMGASQGKGIWSGRVRAGFGQYFMGTSPLYYFAVVLYRLPKHPVVYGSVAMLWGYLSSALKRAPGYEDAEFRRFLRRYQHACLRLGKARATRKVTQQQARVWERAHAGATGGGIAGGMHDSP